MVDEADDLMLVTNDGVVIRIDVAEVRFTRASRRVCAS